MKKTILVFNVAVFALLASCKKDNKIVNQTKIQDSEKFVIDSISVEDSLKISDKLKLDYSSKILLYPSIKDKNLLDSIYFSYKGISDYSKKNLSNFLNQDKTKYFNETKTKSKDWIDDIRYNQTWNTYFKMSQISHKNDFLQIEYLSSAYEGGAHDNYWFSDRVFDLKNKKKLLLSDITSIHKKKLSQILRKNLDRLHSGTNDSKGIVKNSEMLLVDVIEPNDNFYFDEKNLYFHYSPYEITAFAAGDIVIPVGWQELNRTLNPDFQKRLKIK